MTFKGAIGIDLGTTYSCVAAWHNEQIEVFSNDQGNRTTPSCVAFDGSERLIGDGAKNQIASNPSNTVFDVKRLIGRNFSDPKVKEDMAHWPFKVIDKGDNKPLVQVEYSGAVKTFTPEEISAMVLKKMKEFAEVRLGKEVNKAVITVPAYFNDSQRQATKDAGTIAGLEVLRIINEPTAAAIAYGFDKESEGNRNVLIFDLGGGTFDVTLLKVSNKFFQVKATNGDSHLGGEDFNNRLVTHFIEEFKRKNNGKDISKNQRALRRLYAECERAKRVLSSNTEAVIEIEGLFDAIDFNSTITRARFEELCDDLFSSTLEPVESVLKDAKMEKREVDEVVLVGGSTRIPKVQQLVSEFFDGKELNKSINPDEAVAYGAAVQAFILAGGNSGRTDNLLLLDVNPLSLGVEVVFGGMSVIIERNTTIPTTRTKEYTTFFNNQTDVVIKVFEGERAMTKDCNLLGEFDLTGIPPAPAGVPKIDVTFQLSTDGILDVSAEEKSTGNSGKITVKSSKGRLTDAEIKRMVSEAAKYATLDTEKRERYEAKLSLESYIYKIKSVINNPTVASKLDDTKKSRIKDECERISQWLTSNQEAAKDVFVKKLNDLETLCDLLMGDLYNEYVVGGMSGNMGGSARADELD